MVFAFLAFSLAHVSQAEELIMRFVHAGEVYPALPDCSWYKEALSRRVNRVFERLGFRRQLQGQIDCASFCQNIVSPFCIIASNGLCENRRRQLRDQSPPPEQRSLSAIEQNEECERKADRIRYEIVRFGEHLEQEDNACYSTFYDEWDVTCYHVDV